MLLSSIFRYPLFYSRDDFPRIRKRRWLKQLWIVCCFIVGIGLWQPAALTNPAGYGGYDASYSNGYPADYQTGYPTVEASQDENSNLDSNRERSLTPPDIQRILDRNKLIVAVLDSDNAPFFMTGDNNPENLIGLDVKIAKGLAEALGVDVEFNRSADTFNGVVEQVYQLEADIAISKLSQTLQRARQVKFSRPYVNMRQGLLVNRIQLAKQANGKGTIQAIRDLNGEVGVIQGSSYVGFLKQKFPKATVKEYENWDDIVAAVNQGEVDAAYRDELEVKKEIIKNPDASLLLQTIALTDTKDQIAMALPWDSIHLQDFVNQYLDSFSLDYNADLVLQEYADYIAAH